MPGDRSDADEFCPRINLRDLLVFQVLADALSTTMAAERLGVTQSAVSQALGRLERWLDAELLDRSSRPLRLTHGGEVLRRGVADVLQTVKRTADEVRAESSAKLPIIRLGLVDSFATTAGPEMIRTLQQRIQKFRVWSGITPVLGAELLDRSLDLIVASDPMTGCGDLAHQVLFRENLVAAVPRAARDRFDGLSLEQMCGALPLIRYSRRSEMGRTVEHYLDQRRVHPEFGLEFDVSEAVLRMVASGIGWAVTTPLCLLQARFQTMEIDVLPLPGTQAHRRLYVVHRPGELTRVMPEIIATCRACVRTDILANIERLIPWPCADMPGPADPTD